MRALMRQIEALAQRQPVVIVVEDAHWLDPTSREFLDRTVEDIRGLRILLLITYRPEFQAPWIGQAHVTSMALNRLGQRDGIALVEHMSGKTLSNHLVAQIVTRSDGVPLFVEELTKTVLESALVTSRDGQVFPPLAVPATLQASLQARLDRIEAAKEVAQAGAIIGREFSHALLIAVAGLPEPKLLHGLQQLVEAGLATSRGTPPDASYTFKHALVRDTAYGMLLRGHRRELHARAAAALEDQSPELREVQPELLAHHYTEAGLIELAITYWAKAGRRSVARSAMIEAAAQLRQALRLVPELPEGSVRLRQEQELQGALGGVLFALQAWSGGEAVHAYTRAHELAEQLGDVEAMIPLLAGLVTYHIGHCDTATRARLQRSY